MANERNLYLSDELLQQLQAGARTQGKTAGQFSEEVIREMPDFEQLSAAGHRHAAERGFKPFGVLPQN